MEILTLENCSVLTKPNFFKIEEIMKKCPHLQELTLWGDPAFTDFQNQSSLSMIKAALEERPSGSFRLLKTNRVLVTLAFLQTVTRYIEVHPSFPSSLPHSPTTFFLSGLKWNLFSIMNYCRLEESCLRNIRYLLAGHPATCRLLWI